MHKSKPPSHIREDLDFYLNYNLRMKKLFILIFFSIYTIQSLADPFERYSDYYWDGDSGFSWQAVVLVVMLFDLMPVVQKLCGLWVKILPDKDWAIYIWLIGAIIIVLGVYWVSLITLLSLLSR